MKFEHAQTLWLLVVVMPLLAWFLYWTWRRKQSLMAKFVQTRLLSRLLVGVSPARQKVRLVLVALAVAFGIIAMARPQWGYGWEQAKQRGLDIVVAIDTSRSMLAEDVKPNRMTRAKLAALDLLRLAKNDRLGLVPFAGSAFLQCPLTLDEEAFRQSVDALSVGIIPQGGSAMAEAIQTAVKAYKDEGDNHKVMILITDGEDTEDGAIEAAKQAAKEGMRIFTIGLGSAEGEMIRVPVEGGKTDFLRDNDGNVLKSRLNETLLQQIAGAGNGFYLNMRGIDTMNTLYEKGLAPLPKTEITAKLVRRYHERFYIPLGLAMLCLLIEMFMPQRARSGVEAGSQPVTAAGAALLFFAFTLNATASSSSAARDYKSGNYQAARKEFEELIDKNPSDPRLHYNSGTAAYKAKNYEQAARSFNTALTAPDLTLQQKAFYNLGNTWYQIGGEYEEPEDKIEAWEQAVKQYDGALRLDPQDKDAEYNRELVKKKLEMLKQQQAQEQSQEGKQDENQQKQQQQKKQKGKQKGKGDSSSDSGPESRDPKNQKKKGKDKDKEKGPGEKEKDKEKGDGKDKDKDNDKGKDKGEKQGDEPEDQDAEQRALAAMGQMTMQQAKQLLDAQKGEERALIFKPVETGQPKNRIFKDW
jgi:Ca-activated chloride channel family protein